MPNHEVLWLGKMPQAAREEFEEITTEANYLVGEFFELDDFDVFDRDKTGKSSIPEALVIKLVSAFVWFKLHKYTEIEKRQYLGEWFGLVRATINHHLRDVESLIRGDERRSNDISRCFRKTWPDMQELGIRLNVEGWIRSSEMRIRFIDRQIDKMQKRREEIIDSINIRKA